jgi:DNA repair exonuclease SbcCD ATPase subunit
MSASPPPPSDASARLDVVAKERDALRQEVTELRKSLESVQQSHVSNPSEDASNHEEEMQSLREELEEANEGKEHFETQYKNLLGRVNTIKTSLGDRLKADAVGGSFNLMQTVAGHGWRMHADGRRHELRTSKVIYQTSRNRSASYKRTTATSRMSSSSCGKRTRHKPRR